MGYIDTIERVCPNCKGASRDVYASGFDFEYKTCENEFSFVLCKGCGLVYLNPMPHSDSMADIYPPDYKPYHFNDGKRDIILMVRNILEKYKARYYKKLLPENARILDVGCGDGRYLSILKEVEASWQLEGVDFGEIAVKRAREKGLSVMHGRYETLDLEESAYDLIILNQVIEHFIDPEAMVFKLLRELKPGGFVNIETPSLDGWDARIFQGSFWGGYHFPRHITIFDEQTIKIFLESRGLRVMDIRYLPSPVFWVFSWHHAWERKIGWGAGFFSDKNPLVLGMGTALDIIQRIVRKKTSNMQVVALKA